MAVLKNKDGTQLLVDCCCGCDAGIRMTILRDDIDCYCFMTYTNGRFYSEQAHTLWGVISKKLEKIWAIIRNKDYYYSDIVMTRAQFEEFKDYINSIE